MSPIRVVFMGSPDFAVPSLLALLALPKQFEVVLVVCQPDKVAGRGRKIKSCAVKVTALAQGLPVFQPAKMKIAETEQTLRSYQPDIAVVAAYGRILPPHLLSLPAHGCINVHASLLPKYRGASPINHAIMAGDKECGVAIMEMEEGLDTGGVFASAALPISLTIHAGELTELMADLGAQLLCKVLPKIISGKITCTPQAELDGHATYAPLLKKSDGELDFTKDAATLARRVRGLHPWPMTYSETGGLRVQVLEAKETFLSDEEKSLAYELGAGRVVAVDQRRIIVACGDFNKGFNGLLLIKVKPAGKKEMEVSAWLAGRGIRLGDLFEIPK